MFVLLLICFIYSVIVHCSYATYLHITLLILFNFIFITGNFILGNAYIGNSFSIIQCRWTTFIRLEIMFFWTKIVANCFVLFMLRFLQNQKQRHQISFFQQSSSQYLSRWSSTFYLSYFDLKRISVVVVESSPKLNEISAFITLCQVLTIYNMKLTVSNLFLIIQFC